MDGVGGHNIVDHNIFMDIITVWPLNIFPITYNLQKNKENKNKVGTDITLSYLMHCNSHNLSSDMRKDNTWIKIDVYVFLLP